MSDKGLAVAGGLVGVGVAAMQQQPVWRLGAAGWGRPGEDLVRGTR